MPGYLGVLVRVSIFPIPIKDVKSHCAALLAFSPIIDHFNPNAPPMHPTYHLDEVTQGCDAL